MLFNKNNKGSEELKALLGFIYASITFDNLKTYIDIAQNDLIEDVIGQEIYNVAQAHYDSSNYEIEDSGSGSGRTFEDLTNLVHKLQLPEDVIWQEIYNVAQAHYDSSNYEIEDSGSGSGRTFEDLTNLVHKLQLPIALMAYRNYANSNDITHSNKGRQIFVSDDEKPAFEWMIKRDDDNIISTAYRTTDLMLKYLEDNIDLFPEYSTSTSYAKQKELFINTAKTFDSFFPIEKSRRLFVVLVPFIKDIERKTLKSTLGIELFNDLKDYVKGDDSGTDMEELLSYVQPALVLLTMSMAVRRLPVRVLPSGIFQSYLPETISISPKKVADKDVRETFGYLLERDGHSELQKLEEYLKRINNEAEGKTYSPAVLTDRHSEDNKYFRM